MSMHDTMEPSVPSRERRARRAGAGQRTTAFRLVATDLDGTLLRSDASVSPRTQSALRRVAARGMHHIIVTGRPASGCGPFFESIGYKGLAVCGQGAQIYDAGAERLLSSAELDRDVARSAVALIIARTGPLELAVVTSGPEGEFVVTEGFRMGDDRELAPFRTSEAELLWEWPIDKVLLRHRSLPDDLLAAVASKYCGPSVTVTHSARNMVEVLPSGVDKASGLARVARQLGVDGRDVIAFGDMPNDIPMLAWAGRAVAMGNCHPDLKAVADEVTCSNDADGVALVLERLLDEGGSN